MALQIRVLHIDDDAQFALTAKEILRDVAEDLIIDSVSNADEAFNKILAEKYDVIISDYEMPIKNGLDLLKQLRENRINTPFILFTGKGREEVAIKALNYGADRYLDKHGNIEVVYKELAISIHQLYEKNLDKKRLWESEERFKKMVENLKDIVMLTKNDGTILYISPSCKEIIGYDQNEFVGKHFSIAHPDDYDKVKNNFKNALTKISAGNLDYRIVTKKGETKWVHHSYSQIIDNGKITLVVSIVTDVTESKKAEEALRESEERYHVIAENMQDVITVTDFNGVYTYVSPSAQQLFGYKYDEMIGRCAFELIHPDEMQSIVLPNLPVLTRGGSMTPVEFRFKIKDGSYIWLEGRVNSYIEANGKSRLIVVSRDIQKRKKAEEAARISQYQLEIINQKLQVVGSLTRHDVGNKLSTAQASTYLLRKRLQDKPELLKYLDAVDEAFNQSNKILEFSRLYEKVGLETPILIDVGEQFEIAANLRPHNQTEIINNVVGLRVLADNMLQQLFYNLIDNSLKHGKTLTTITLNYEEDSGHHRLIYGDNGVGIPKENKTRIFSEGFTTGGSGLGLKLVKRMIEVYGWKVNEQGEPGKGTKFVITIPKNT